MSTISRLSFSNETQITLRIAIPLGDLRLGTSSVGVIHVYREGLEWALCGRIRTSRVTEHLGAVRGTLCPYCLTSLQRW